jgi:hypothetical protein
MPRILDMTIATEPIPVTLDPRRARRVCHGGRAVAWAMVAFIVLSFAAAFTSDGFLDTDAATHYLFARYAFRSWFYLVNIWGRPLTTGLYAPAAALGGRLAVRCVSLICALLCSWIAWRIAIGQRYRWPALAAIFTLGQPLLFLHSFSEMTELPFAVVAGLAFLAYQRRNWSALAIAASFLPLGRPEGFAFCVLAAMALLLHRRWIWLGLIFLPTIAWSYAGWAVEGRNGDWWHWLVQAWPYASASDYQRGALLHFVLLLPMLVSPVALPAVLIGMTRGLRVATKTYHRSRCQALIAAIPLTVLVAHSLFFWLGKFSSDGELRYLLIVAPLWGLLAADGWEWAFDRFNFSRPVAWAALLLILPLQLNWLVPIVPLRMDSHWQASRQLVAWYEHSPLRQQYPRLLFADPALDYYLAAGPDDPVRSTPWKKELFTDFPTGTMVIWDSQYAQKNSDPSRDMTAAQVLADGWHEISPPAFAARIWRIFISNPEPSAR